MKSMVNRFLSWSRFIALCFALTSTISPAASTADDGRTEWGAWENFDRFPGLKFRTRISGYNSHAKKWMHHVGFRNDSRRRMDFNARLEGDLLGRFDLKPGETEEGWSLLTHKNRRVTVRITDFKSD